MRFKAKPVFIEANQFDGTYKCMKQLELLFPEITTASASYHIERNSVNSWEIRVGLNYFKIQKSNWIFRDQNGKVYPVENEKLMSLYEPAIGLHEVTHINDITDPEFSEPQMSYE